MKKLNILWVLEDELYFKYSEIKRDLESQHQVSLNFTNDVNEAEREINRKNLDLMLVDTLNPPAKRKLIWPDKIREKFLSMPQYENVLQLIWYAKNKKLETLVHLRHGEEIVEEFIRKVGAKLIYFPPNAEISPDNYLTEIKKMFAS